LMSATSPPQGAVQCARPVWPLMAWSRRRTAAPRSPEPQRRTDRLSSPGLTTPRDSRAGTRFAHSSRAKKVSPPPSSAALRPGGCVVDRLRPDDRHRGRGGRGLANSKEKW